jgi:hypothetical protein
MDFGPNNFRISLDSSMLFHVVRREIKAMMMDKMLWCNSICAMVENRSYVVDQT